VKHDSTETDIREYFWSLVDKNGTLPDPATGVKSKCWLWLGSGTDQGYGRFNVRLPRHTLRAAYRTEQTGDITFEL